ncbi:MAG: fumarylacetoacetate hydrolase family protein [Ilumatobacteraceae bacterium]
MTFRLANLDSRAALVDGGHYYDVATASGGTIGSDPMDAIAACDALHELTGRLGDLEPAGSLDAVALGPPVPRPRNSFGIGLNYRAHAEESGVDLPPFPVVFTKYPSCIAGPTADVELRSEHADYEAELVVVIGQAGRDIAAADAWDHVAGVTAGQDISDRKVQFAAKPPHFGLGKSRDGYGPIGPVLVAPDALADLDALSITCDVNGERRQTGNTSDLIFDVPALIEYISGILTLEPGDLIFTGTPEGVGVAQGKFLAPGDVVTTTIEGIGTMTNVCR